VQASIAVISIPPNYWEKVDQAGWDDAVKALDRVNGTLWRNAGSTQHGLNDKIPAAVADKLTSSLYLIRPGEIEIHVASEGGQFGPPRRRVRASFVFNRSQYNFIVTDLIIEKRYLAQKNGSYPVEDAIFCVSLSGLYYGHAHKLVAAIIEPT